MRTNLEVSGDLGWYNDHDRTEAERTAYLHGMAAGFKIFAWWKDGKQFVGTCGMELRDAVRVLFDEDDRLKAEADERRKGD